MGAFLRGVVDFYVAVFLSILLVATAMALLAAIAAPLLAAWAEGGRTLVLLALVALATRYPPTVAVRRYGRYVAGLVAPALALVSFTLVYPRLAHEPGPQPRFGHVAPFLGAVLTGVALGGQARQRAREAQGPRALRPRDAFRWASRGRRPEDS